MRVPALLLFISAMTAQQATSRAPTSDALLSERVSSPGDLALARLTGHLAVEQREADEPGDPSLCFFSREKDVGRQLSCKHRLDLRSKFNYNPFGLRFGKRGGRAEPPKVEESAAAACAALGQTDGGGFLNSSCV